MGSPISGTVAEIFLQQIENKQIKQLLDSKVKEQLQHSRTGGHNEPSTTRDQRLHVQLRSS